MNSKSDKNSHLNAKALKLTCDDLSERFVKYMYGDQVFLTPVENLIIQEALATYAQSANVPPQSKKDIGILCDTAILVCRLKRQLDEARRELATWDWVKESARKNEDHAVLVKLHHDRNFSFLHGDPSVWAEAELAAARSASEALEAGCICKGNWRSIVKKTESLIGTSFCDARGDEYRFFGIVHGDGDYYYGMTGEKGLRLLSCVGSIEGHGFEPINLVEKGMVGRDASEKREPAAAAPFGPTEDELAIAERWSASTRGTPYQKMIARAVIRWKDQGK